MLNKRHKAILFITLVMTGSTLLAGVRLNEALGILILGISLAWLLGSEAAFLSYQRIRTLPGKIWPLLLEVLFMAVGGCLLVLVAFWSNFNSFIVAAALSVYGMLVSPMRQLLTQRTWLRIVVLILGITAFFFASMGALEVAHLTDEAGRIGSWLRRA